MPERSLGKKDFDIHRTLPRAGAVKPHSLKARNTPLEKVAEITPKEKVRGFSFKRSLASVILIIFLFTLTIGIWDAVELSGASKKMFGSGNLFSLLLGNDLKTDASGRVNILLAGYSADDAGHSGANLTDSIMLLSLNQTKKTGYMLSIPRDLWVSIPGYGHAKINEAYQDGNWANFSEIGYPAGGMGLLEKVVSDNFGVPINYYSLINYSAFRDTVNAVGGITIDIKSSDPRGLYDPSLDYTSAACCALANYPNGPVTLNGKQALNLARARGDAYGSYGFGQADFDRTQHQRQMLLALKQKSATVKTILNPTKSGHLFDGMANNVKTDVDIGAALPLYRLFNAVNAGSLQSLSLRDLSGKNYLTDYGGALIPAAGVSDFSAIQAAIQNLNQ
ncbi:MAG: cell envelope-related function transcriptional attenuator, LytR/CpsA family protein nonfunctional [Candidatus Saccharibacteria bacterium]|nr:cell envelope-related function transcriptional attenuator, LytR/CpsA family protein nonfunctional [Candidatus Saccharibacteria bacterium]